jgi:hypothetical protein
MFGPVITGLTIGHGYATALLTGLIVACCLAAVLALGLARWLPANANRARLAGAAGGGPADTAEGPR